MVVWPGQIIPFFLYLVQQRDGWQEGVGLQGDVAEQVRHRLSVVGPADGLSQDHGDVNHLENQSETELASQCTKNRLEYNG